MFIFVSFLVAHKFQLGLVNSDGSSSSNKMVSQMVDDHVVPPRKWLSLLTHIVTMSGNFNNQLLYVWRSYDSISVAFSCSLLKNVVCSLFSYKFFFSFVHRINVELKY